MGGSCSDHLLKDLDQMHQLMPVADPGEGPGGPNPPLFSKNIYWEMPPPPPYLKVWIATACIQELYIYKPLRDVENETDCPLKCEMDVVKVFLLFPYINDRTLSFL